MVCQTLRLGVSDDDGSVTKCNVLKRLGIKPGKFMVERLVETDKNRIKKANKEVEGGKRKEEVQKEAVKKKKRRQ